MTFSELNLNSHITSALSKLGYESPTPIQSQAIPLVLEGQDIFGCAQTGTGKTAAFALPLLQLIHAKKVPATPAVIRALILAPTRELALQINDSFKSYGEGLSIKQTTVFGGVSQFTQVQALRAGTDVLIATPGRLLDLMQQGLVKLNNVKYLVLDEADRMLDMGFIHDIKKIVSKLPEGRQSIFFSATATPEIMKLANTILHQPVQVQVAPVSSASALVEQSVYYVNKDDKKALLNHIIKTSGIDHALIFTRTKHGADKVVKELKREGIAALAIHGNKSQNERVKALKQFKDKSIRMLVATDVASRGIDVEKLSHVINYDIPEQPESYVHRIGRTGRAGETGMALSFCSMDEVPYLKDIHKLIKKNIGVEEHPFAATNVMTAANTTVKRVIYNGAARNSRERMRRAAY